MFKTVPRIRCRDIYALILFKSGCCKLFYDVFMTCVRCQKQTIFYLNKELTSFEEYKKSVFLKCLVSSKIISHKPLI